MDKNVTYRFLIKTAIPENGDKNGNLDRLYDCIWRAHKDVLAGRFHLPEYIDKSDSIIHFLYDLIKNDDELYSEKYINALYKEYNVEFGAIQKLVNMSLKYIIILNTYNQLDLPVNINKCDCPIDSVILNLVKRSDIKWTKISKEEYIQIQQIVSNHSQNGNIVFDFINW